MTLKLNGSSSGSVALDAPTSTTSGADITFKLPVADGAAGQVLTTNGSGQLEWKYPSIGFADQWRITTTFASADTNPISSNWERVDARGSSAPLGTGMSESSGIFTFPQTGYWLVIFRAVAAGTHCDWINAEINVSLNASAGSPTYAHVAKGRDSCKDADSYSDVSAQAIVDVTSVSDVKVRFSVSAHNSLDWYGHTNQSETSAIFLRLGDT